MKQITPSFLKYLAAILLAFAVNAGLNSLSAAVIFADGESAPIVLAGDVTETTEMAVSEMVGFMERMTGVRPEVIKGLPDPLPQAAIWVGYQPILDQLFPGLEFNFEHPEEVLLAANGQHVVITGRDRVSPGAEPRRMSGGRTYLPQMEYGTANAVYTFLQDSLGVRWFWPGEHGDSVIETDRIEVEPFEYRYHPQIRQRDTVVRTTMIGGRRGIGYDWARFQRLQLDSLETAGGHGFTGWHRRFFEENPELLALQPDGTRGTYPSPGNVKVCSGNPDVWAQWLEDVDAQIQSNPDQTVFNASQNDGASSGICVDPRSQAWDHPDGERYIFNWEGLSQESVATTDRDVTFANTLAAMLREKYPDEDYYVQIHAYGPSRPAPLGVVPADNVIISSVANFHQRRNRGGEAFQGHWDQYGDWAKVAPNLVWRPNVGNDIGLQTGLPAANLKQTVEDFRYIAENNCIGIFIDTLREHWGTQAPYYYLLAHLAWNPWIDADALMVDYYQRAFGPAAAELEAYWNLLEETRDRAIDSDRDYPDYYNEAFFAKAWGLLDRAGEKVEDAAEEFQARLDFMRSGLEYVELVVDTRNWMIRYENSGLADEEARAAVLANWDRVDEWRKNQTPWAANYDNVFRNHRRTGGLHPESPQPVRRVMTAERAAAMADSELVPAEADGWELVFVDTFEREELGAAWAPAVGDWRIEDNHLVGAGVLFSTNGYPGDHPPGFLRIEFDATADTEIMGVSGEVEEGEMVVSDMSAFIHARPDDGDGWQAFRNGYFFQFGGRHNTINRILRDGLSFAADQNPELLIVPGQTHHLVAENDQGTLRFWIDGQLIFEEREPNSMMGQGRDRVGLYFFTWVRVNEVRVYTKRLQDDME